ncbi:MAG: hypothetical protein JOY78_06030, partial [Pseudonocardia sp.]|nr:hypothetical protein [Pseudonocardia sp.]
MRARSAATADAELLAQAIALRWSRPDLTAALAEHVATTWAADDRAWVAAAGWLVHGRAAVGDGRECASDILAELAGRNPALLDDPAADRLRIEVATLAAAQGEPAVARLLVEPLGDDRPAEVRADALGVLVRCAFQDRPSAVGDATRRTAAAWEGVHAVDAEIAVAALALLSAAAERRAGRPDAAVDHAAEGLARLDDLPRGASAPHMATALAAEWITALLEAGRIDDARAGCHATAKHLGAKTPPSRQTVLLRLSVARALAASTSAGAFEALEQAATEAAHCDTPDLEGLCCSTLGASHEQTGRLDAALESMRRGVAAQRRDRARSERFRAALWALPLRSAGSVAGRSGPTGVAVPFPSADSRSTRSADRTAEGHPRLVGPWTSGQWTVEDARVDRRLSRRASVPPPGGVADRHEEAASAVDALGVFDVGEDATVSAPDVADNAALDPLFGPLERLADPDGEGGPDSEVASANPSVAPPTTAFEESKDASPYGGRDWLTNALAELDRAWGVPLNDLDPARKRVDTKEDAAADIRLGDGDTSPWASWNDELDARPTAQGQPETEREGAHRRAGEHLSYGGGPRPDRQTAVASRDVDASDSGPGLPSRCDTPERAEVAHPGAPDHVAVPAVAPETVASQDVADGDPVRVGAACAQVIGCVVVVDLLCGGEPATAGTTLLHGVAERLADRIPAGARLRLDDVASVLSVVLPGRDRTVASDWMHRTLPAVFRDSADLGDPALPVSTALRATVHDTEGPVGAQLLQRLDRVRRGDTPPIPVRWGVPIAPGSGGRRRRPEGEGAFPVGPAGPGSRSLEKAAGNGRRGSALFVSNPEGAGDPPSTASGACGTIAATGSRPRATGGTASSRAARGGSGPDTGLSGRRAHSAASGGGVAGGALPHGEAA